MIDYGLQKQRELEEGNKDLLKQKSFFSRWKEGMKKAIEDPEDLLKIRITAYWGSIIGTLAAMGFIIYYGYWYVTLAFAFTLIVTITQIAEENMKLKAIKTAKEQMASFATMVNEESNLEAIG